MKTGDLIDFQGGLYALREGIIESPAEPDVHFTDDPTSAIRAMRFKARYGFRFLRRRRKSYARKFFEVHEAADS